MIANNILKVLLAVPFVLTEKHSSCAFQLTLSNPALSSQSNLQFRQSPSSLSVLTEDNFDTIEGGDTQSEDNDDEDLGPQPELAAILPGQLMNIRVGDTSLARKAWKKRRRSGSPILVPCTILGMNREIMVKWNVMNLVHRFGKPLKDGGGKKGVGRGVALSVGACVKLYKHRLGGNLREHAKALGYRTIVSFFEATFDDAFFEENGIRISRAGPKNELMLSSVLSLPRAREAASKAEFVQLQANNDDLMMLHTGATFQIPDNSEKYQTATPLEQWMSPLSAALRISQTDADSNRVHEGMECNSFILSYEACGDNGSPLLTCAIDPPRAQIRDQMKKRSYVKRQMSKEERRTNSNLGPINGKIHNLDSLKVGDGPFPATVVSISPRAGAAFIDMGVERKRGKKSGGGTARVLGMLRFEDMVNDQDNTKEVADVEDEGEEIIEDISDLFSLDSDGNLSQTDEVTGEVIQLGSIDGDEGDDEETDDLFEGMNAEERLEAIGKMLESEELMDLSKKGDSKNTNLSAGDEVEVYVRAVFNQSGRFMATLNPSIKDRKLKEIKKEKAANKRLSKLAEKLGSKGEKGLQQILDKVGREYPGTVKAKSKTGDWYYIQPDTDEEDGFVFPVGVAESELSEVFSSGDRVQIRLDGIDESRGQLAMTVCSTIAP